MDKLVFFLQSEKCANAAKGMCCLKILAFFPHVGLHLNAHFFRKIGIAAEIKHMQGAGVTRSEIIYRYSLQPPATRGTPGYVLHNMQPS